MILALAAAAFLGVGGTLVLAALRTRSPMHHRLLQLWVVLDLAGGAALTWHGWKDRQATAVVREYPVSPGEHRLEIAAIEPGSGIHLAIQEPPLSEALAVAVRHVIDRPPRDVSWRVPGGDWTAAGPSSAIVDLPGPGPIEVRTVRGTTLVATMDLRSRKMRRIRTAIELSTGGALALFGLAWAVVLMCTKKQ